MSRKPDYKAGRPAHSTEENAEGGVPGPWVLVQRMGPVELLPLGDRRGQQRAAEWPGDSKSTGAKDAEDRSGARTLPRGGYRSSSGAG